jgi:hypothetical protein
MKNLFALAILALTTLSLAAADTVATLSTTPYAETTVIGGGTNKVVALSTSAWYSVSLPLSTDVGFFVDMTYLNAVGAGDVNSLRVEWQEGIGQSTYASNIWRSQVFQANATTTTANSSCTNLTFNAIPYARFRLCNVSTNAHVTNLTVKIFPKQNGVRTRNQ